MYVCTVGKLSLSGDQVGLDAIVAAGLSSGQRLSNIQGSCLKDTSVVLLGMGGGGLLQIVAGKNVLEGLINFAAMFLFRCLVETVW